jgi:signal transduction histidine kinase
MSTGPLPEPRRRTVFGLKITGEVRIWILVAVLLATSASLFIGPVMNLEPLHAPLRFPLWSVAVMFFIGELLVVHLQLKRDAYTFTLTDIALTLSLFFADPAHVIIGQVIGSAVAIGFFRRQQLIKGAFNVSHYSVDAALATLLFHALVSHSDPLNVATWGVVALCTALVSTLGTLVVGLAIHLSGARQDRLTLARGLGFGYGVTAANTSISLLAVYILWKEPYAAALLIVPTALLFAAYRAYIAQRDKTESVEFLYESSRSVQRQESAEEAVMTLLLQARDMFRAETTQVTLFTDEEGTGIRSVVGPGDRLDVMKRVTLDPKQGVWARVTAEAQALLIPHPIENDRLRVYFASRGVYKDAMVAPLFGTEGVIGTMVVGDRLGDVSTFDEEDLRLFETLANHASVSLENARLVDQLKGSLAHLTEMNRLKDDFVAAVSHELRTPLTSIQGYVKTLLRPEMRDFDPDERTSFLEAVDRQSERLRALIEDLLVVARLDAHEVVPILTPVHIADVVDRVVTELRDPLAQHPLSVEMDPELPRIQSDEGKIQQILTNLIDNACKYTPDGSDIVVRVHPEGEGITISVVDTGAGIPPEQQDLVFDRFYQVDQSSTRKAGGTGLGLYLCRRLSEALGGRIWLERSDATGSTFSLWVPAAVTPHEGARAAESVN